MNATLRPQSLAAVDLLRLLALWLAVALVLQGLLAAQARGLGPLHRHRGDMVATVAAAHAHVGVRAALQEDTHDRAHAGGAGRHAHAPGDPSLLPADEGTDALDGGAFALAAMLALAAAVAWPRAAGLGRHVWRAGLGWAWRTAWSPPHRRPPRRA